MQREESRGLHSWPGRRGVEKKLGKVTERQWPLKGSR